MDINEQFREALELLEHTSDHVFVTGKAGTGKSTLLKYFWEHTQKRIVVAAPTGVAAVNVGGETIHSLFGFRPDIDLQKAIDAAKKSSKKELFKNLDTIVIDEISMVRADLMDCMDVFLQEIRASKKPFGGIQLAGFGDLYQLPPVVMGQEKAVLLEMYKSAYFFDARVWSRTELKLIELAKIYRQKDEKFIEILNAIRNKTVNEIHMQYLSTRQLVEKLGTDEGYISLTATNEAADLKNLENLAKLKGKAKIYKGFLEGDFEKSGLPTELELQLKVNTRVMLLSNDREKRWINGTLGKVTKLLEDAVMVKVDDGGIEEVGYHSWTNYKSEYDSKSKSIHREIAGSFIQLPLRLAWAVTIHKAQGKTFDKVIVDMGRGAFAAGQFYVALSRCRSMEGIRLMQTPRLSDIKSDWRVTQWLADRQFIEADKKQSRKVMEELLEEAIEYGKKMKIVYLDKTESWSERTILPKRISLMEYEGHEFTALEAFCFEKMANRIFSMKRVLEVRNME